MSAPPPAPETETRKQRFKQICDALHVEWRLKAQGIHHDHLSDLSFLIAEVEYLEAQLTHHQQTETALRALVVDMRTIEMVAGQCSIEGPEGETATLMAAAESERCRKWSDRVEALLSPAPGGEIK